MTSGIFSATTEPSVSNGQPRHRRGHRADAESVAEVAELLDQQPLRPDRLIEHLHTLQDRVGHLRPVHLVALAQMLKLAPVEVMEVASFYHHFDLCEQAPPLTLRVCNSLSCQLAGADALLEQLHSQLGERIRIQPVPCVGRCDSAPVAVLGQHPIEHASGPKIELALHNNDTTATIPPQAQNYQQYCADGGYQTLCHLLTTQLTPEKAIQRLEQSGLRGLGGAGFPVARKWQLISQQAGPRYLAVNLDEGEPGTFKDRYYLEREPHKMLEGALIAATVVGCERIYIYLRDEYAGCHQLLQREIEALRTQPPGKHRLPVIELRRGAGAYICGEESAMIESLEGKRGMPRQRPPFVGQQGVFGRPTLVHNGESLYWVTELLARGSIGFRHQGRRGRQGLRSFSVSGRVAKPGVYLAPAGISVRELIDEYAGGMASGHRFYGYFPGGASGGMLPAALGDVALDFDTLTEYGCFIGSAAVIVFSHQDNARELALNAMRFFAHESCGQCTPCRVGTARAVTLMEQASWDVDTLNQLSQVMQDASICGLGQAAPNPLLCALRYFPQEFAATRLHDAAELGEDAP